MTRSQLNVRVSEVLERAIDERRIELRSTLGYIPTRSDVLRFALESYLGIDLSQTEADGRTTRPKARTEGGNG